jgi:hypothetical protein
MQYNIHFLLQDMRRRYLLDDTHLSKDGKHIPMDRQSAQPHICEETKAAQVS